MDANTHLTQQRVVQLQSCLKGANVFHQIYYQRFSIVRISQFHFTASRGRTFQCHREKESSISIHELFMASCCQTCALGFLQGTNGHEIASNHSPRTFHQDLQHNVHTNPLQNFCPLSPHANHVYGQSSLALESFPLIYIFKTTKHNRTSRLLRTRERLSITDREGYP